MVAFAAFNDLEGEQYPPVDFNPNASLAEVLIDVARRELKWWQFRKKRALALVLSEADFRFELEAQLTYKAMRAGALPPENQIGATYDSFYNGQVVIYGGVWTDFFDWIIQNWPAIMEMILSIISLFASGQITNAEAIILIGMVLNSIGG